jgi:hypothetical protein
LTMLVTDLDLLTRWLAAGRVSPQTAARIVATAIRQAEADVQRIEQGGATLRRLRELSRPRPAGQALPPADAAVVQRAEQLETRFIPNGDPLHDSTLVRAHLAEEVSSGASSDATRVSEQFEGALNTQKTNIAVEVQRAEAARLKLAAARPAAAVRVPRKASEAAGGYEIPLEPAPGSAWAQAEQALRDGDYAGAKKLYRTAYFDNHELTERLFEALDQRAGEAWAASKVPRIPLGPKQPTSAEFAPGQVERILSDNSHFNTERLRTDPEVMSRVFEYADSDGAYILKEIKTQKWPDMTDQDQKDAVEALYRAADNEIVASRLMDALGIPCARVGAHAVKNAKGEVESIRLVMRKIDGRELGELSAGQLLQYADDLSAQRAFGIIIRDYDRKLPNAMLGKDGRVYYIDAGVAEFRNQNLLQDPNWVKRPYVEEGFFGQDHYYIRSEQHMRELAGKTERQSVAEYKSWVQTHLVERSLTANGAQPMVRRIESMLDPAPDKQAKLLNLLTSAFRESRGISKTAEEIREMAEQSIKTMRIRQQRLPEVLKHLNERNGIRLPAETNPSQLLRFPTPPEPIARASRVAWRVAA